MPNLAESNGILTRCGWQIVCIELFTLKFGFKNLWNSRLQITIVRIIILCSLIQYVRSNMAD